VLSPLCGFVATSALLFALLCWPTRVARVRLARFASYSGTSTAAVPAPRYRPRGVALVITGLAGTALGWLITGEGGALGLVLIAVTAAARWRARRAEASRMAAHGQLAAALGLLTAELRAGVHPAVAAQRVAGDAGPAVTELLETIEGTARLSGDVASIVRRFATRAPTLAEPLGRLAAAWQLAEQHGIGLADVLDAVRRDLDHRVRAARSLTAALAGPRATSLVLAALPLLGLLLGQAVGAAPFRVLTASAAGQVLLVVGSALVCLGVIWSARLVARAAAP
jgi:tight adherence protein B